MIVRMKIVAAAVMAVIAKNLMIMKMILIMRMKKRKKPKKKILNMKRLRKQLMIMMNMISADLVFLKKRGTVIVEGAAFIE